MLTGRKEETFADRLQSLREAAGISQYRLAQLSGVTKQTVSRLEAGLTQPAWETVVALARGLGVEVGAFVTGPGLPVESPPARPRGRPPKSPSSMVPAAELEVKGPARRERKGK
jgi:transcriptional regulator with XRE-family HTH domain